MIAMRTQQVAWGKKGSAVKIRDVKQQLKDRSGLTQQQVMSNLTYLIDNGWIKTVDIKKEINVRGNVIPQVTTFYEIDAKGIDKIEGGSQFEPKAKYEGINITASGQNIITLGDGNIVNAEFVDLHQALGELKNALSAANGIDESTKLEAAIDIESIRDQLAKADPDRGVMKKLWESLEGVSTVGGVAAAFEKAAELIGPLIGM